MKKDLEKLNKVKFRKNIVSKLFEKIKINLKDKTVRVVIIIIVVVILIIIIKYFVYVSPIVRPHSSRGRTNSYTPRW